MKTTLKRWFPPGTTGHWLLKVLRSTPLAFPFIVCRSIKATRKLTGKIYPIKVRLGKRQSFSVIRPSSATVIIDGNLQVSSWGGSKLPSSITCGSKSTLRIRGNFIIGPNVHIRLCHGATLTLGGQRNSTGSGITGNSRIMVEKSIEIGADCMISWDVFITDSDWHTIQGCERCSAVSIGDNVLISHGASILKGVTIPTGVVVGAKSLVLEGHFVPKSLIAGVPATTRRTNVEWAR